jgi:prenyltransferase beta subunit
MKRKMVLTLAVATLTPVVFLQGPAPADDKKKGLVIRERPAMVTPRIEKSIKKGLNWLKNKQNADGSWSPGGRGYGYYSTSMTALAGMALVGSGSTTTRGPYAKQVARSVDYLINKCTRSDGVICAPSDSGRSMYGHGFAQMYLAVVYGMEQDLTRQRKIKKALKKAIRLTAKSQSLRGGWYYSPESSNDEGSVTVTQVQALRACRNAGLTVPKKTIKQAIKYIEKSRCPDGGIAYSVGRGGSRPPITAAAVAVLYNAGKYDSKMAKKALEYCKKRIAIGGNSTRGGWFGHYFYSHLYYSQAMYQSGDKDWKWYYPRICKALLGKQGGDGSWAGGVGKVYSTSLALTILQLPYENIPLYGR